MKLQKLFLRLTTFLVTAVLMAAAKRNKVVYCGACLGLIDEMEWGLSTTDESKTIEVGSFRIDSHGKQKLNTIPLKQSEVHILELLENACFEVGKYSERTIPGSDKTNFIRPNSRDGVQVSKKNTAKDPRMQKLLQFACDTILEDHEDDIVQLYREAQDEIKDKLCVEMTGWCLSSNITEANQAREDAIADAILEEADRNAAKNAVPVSEEDEREEDDEEENDKEDEDDTDENDEENTENSNKDEL